MEGQPVLRIFRCRPLRAGFDQTLRDVLLPDMLARPGLSVVYVARQGPDESGDRLVASVWSSVEAMATAMDEDAECSTLHAVRLGETTERRLEVLPVTHALHGAEADPTVLRLARGATRDGELDAYTRQVMDGVGLDLEAGHAPIALYYVARPPTDFVTLTVWRRWDDLAIATGTALDRPISTRTMDHLATFDVEHFEVLPEGVGRAVGDRIRQV